jgi:hypothetical protein
MGKKNFLSTCSLWMKCSFYFFILCFFIIPKMSLALDKELFLQMLNKPLPDWMEEQIQKDLAPFTDKLSPKQLDEWHHRYPNHLTIRVKISDRQLQVTGAECSTAQSMIKGLCLLNDFIPLPNVDFLLSVEDGFFPQSPEDSVPIFAVAKSLSHKGVILFPDWCAMNGYPNSQNKIMEGSKQYPWDKKTEKMFWRGATTGNPSPNNWRDSSRIKLALLSLQYPDFLDAKITSIIYPSLYVAIQKAGIFGDFVSMTEHVRYKYLIDVDGNTCTWPRCYELLLSNSVMFKQESNDIQWFYLGIIPYEHYVPCANDLSDIFDKFQWAKENDILVEKIAKNATDFALHWLSQESVFLYAYRLLEEYAKLQQSCN